MVSYGSFDVLALLLPLAVLVAPGQRPGGRRGWAATVTLGFTALLWTGPWDDYLVRTGVWSYAPGGVVARIGNVPVEEYAFMVLEVLLVAAWSRRVGSLPDVPAPTVPGGRGRWSGALGWSAAALVGLAATEMGGQVRYAGLILVWAAPPLALQRLVAGDVLRQRRRARLFAALPMVLWLAAADRLALALGIWTISPSSSTGWLLAGLPLEEVLFFCLTCVLVVDGLVLATDPAVVRRLRPTPVWRPRATASYEAQGRSAKTV